MAKIIYFPQIDMKVDKTTCALKTYVRKEKEGRYYRCLIHVWLDCDTLAAFHGMLNRFVTEAYNLSVLGQVNEFQTTINGKQVWELDRPQELLSERQRLIDLILKKTP